jgi:GntR family transcriptional regulator / MocR family aminotransferase
MRRRAESAAMLPIHVDTAMGEPLYRQAYREIAQLVLTGRLKPGMRMPSSRALAAELGVARNTILLAMEQLMSEGYIETRHGSGTYVAASLPGLRPDRPHRALAGAAAEASKRRKLPGFARLAARLAAPTVMPLRSRGLFAPGMPDCNEFPFELWGRLLAKTWRRPAPTLLTSGEPGGFRPLRAAIADYLAVTRAVRCEADQVLIVSGIRQALALCARLLLEPDDPVWIENPGYPGLRGPLVASGAQLIPVAIDAEGMSIASGITQAVKPRLICVAPSHQYPLGTIMSLARRLALLDHARRADAWIFEDDYDSEWRYEGKPLAAMQGLDRDGCVIYAGTFSKVLFPSIRLGFMVVPAHALDHFLGARIALDEQPSLLAQPALAEFIAAGHFTTHLRRQRRRYKCRQELLLAAAAKHLDGLISVAPDPGGMHLIGYLSPRLAERMDDREASRRAAAIGIDAPPVSAHWIGRPRQEGLMLGYTALADDAIEPAVARLAKALAK